MDVDKKFTFDFDELKSANLPLDELFALEINHRNVKYEFLIRFSSNNKNLICFGSGAYDPNIISPPIYRRHSWHTNFEESVIYYNDPTLYNDPDLRLGWGVGENEEWYLPVIAEIIQILASKN
ncbi:MAG: glycosyl transferase family 2, partial [Methanobacterium sp.]|nr:glycosyl transferase family 2 [Methanobacterium sp.]